MLGGGGAQCAPPWFLEPKKSLVWIGLRKDLLGEDASDLSIPEGNNQLEWVVGNIVSGLQTDEEDLFPTCPTETQEEEADEENESERTTNVSRGRTTDTFSAPVSASSTVVEEDLEEDESLVP